jgi:cytochrome c556
MDDEFLHRLRREPPAAFATRLKWQLDRPVPARRSRSRLILGLAICGTAFALVSPPGRRALGEWFATTTGPVPNGAPDISIPATPSATGSVAVSPAPIGRPRAGPPREASSVSSIPAPQAAPTEGPAPLEAARNEAQPAAAVSFTPTAIIGSPSQTPQMQAANAVSLRRGLFLNLDFVVQPLDPILRRSTPLDFKVVRSGATRLATLSPLIPEVFRADTTPFELNTRAQDRIWIDTKDFEAKAVELTLAADSLATAAATDDEVATLRAIGRIEAACNACHEIYRRK